MPANNYWNYGNRIIDYFSGGEGQRRWTAALAGAPAGAAVAAVAAPAQQPRAGKPEVSHGSVARDRGFSRRDALVGPPGGLQRAPTTIIMSLLPVRQPGPPSPAPSPPPPPPALASNIDNHSHRPGDGCLVSSTRGERACRGVLRCQCCGRGGGRWRADSLDSC